MNTSSMLRTAILYYRQREQTGRLKFLPGRRLKNSYVTLDLVLARLANQMGWFKSKPVPNSKQHRKQLLVTYVNGLGHYLLIANLRNWNQLVLISSLELKKLGSHDRSKDLSQLYLAVKKMLYNSYFSHRQTDFVYSWKMYLKLGLCDLDLTTAEITKQFAQTFGPRKNGRD